MSLAYDTTDRFLTLAARLVDHWVPRARRLEPQAFAATVIRANLLELDLRLEAAGADELGEVMAKDGYMAAPKIATSRRMYPDPPNDPIL